jgi:hypothetical protein
MSNVYAVGGWGVVDEQSVPRRRPGATDDERIYCAIVKILAATNGEPTW